ncbi:tyrosine phosphatase [Microdochium bolleyi]|uniref:Very-long-chain (3R)-3-hydroxyacyl-CoA dehydratase n=1 Tax=Microdochium bolleyi TaxID=196109 RepID=A0A136J1T5_9PEZI|nr:tyrosine phosphatase [Microdochium bolleyi]
MASTKKQQQRPSSGASPADYYLIFYNLVSALTWAYILHGTVAALLAHTPSGDWAAGNAAVWRSLHGVALATETAAALEVLHAALGLVRASPLTTALQVAGRNTVLWAIARNYPDIMEHGVGAGYATLLLAWSAAEVIRYSYFVVALAGKIRGGGGTDVPRWLVWIRYSMFIPLYPAGILSECWLIYNVIEPSKQRQAYYQYLLWFGLLIYIPASYILGTHMFAQRRKVLRGSGKAGKHA